MTESYMNYDMASITKYDLNMKLEGNIFQHNCLYNFDEFFVFKSE